LGWSRGRTGGPGRQAMPGASSGKNGAPDAAEDELHPDHARTDWDFDGTPGTTDDWTAFQGSYLQGCCQ